MRQGKRMLYDDLVEAYMGSESSDWPRVVARLRPLAKGERVACRRALPARLVWLIVVVSDSAADLEDRRQSSAKATLAAAGDPQMAGEIERSLALAEVCNAALERLLQAEFALFLDDPYGGPYEVKKRKNGAPCLVFYTTGPCSRDCVQCHAAARGRGAKQ